MIRLAKIADLDDIKSLTEACASALQEQNIYQWNKFYPSREKLSNDIQKQEMYVYSEGNLIQGIIVLTSVMDEEYLPIEWLSETGNNLYIHRLAVHPSKWGKGIGQKLMDFAETFARENNYVSVRLDTFSQNKRNQRFYENRGYQRLGDIYFPLQSEFPFHCYELLI